jgi:hypothetical protein
VRAAAAAAAAAAAVASAAAAAAASSRARLLGDLARRGVGLVSPSAYDANTLASVSSTSLRGVAGPAGERMRPPLFPLLVARGDEFRNEDEFDEELIASVLTMDL